MRPHYTLRRAILSSVVVASVACSSLPGEAGDAAAEAQLETASTFVGGAATAVTGNPAIGAGLGALVLAVGGFFVHKRRKAAKAPAA